MRRVVPSREVYHLWANRAQPDAHNSSHSVSFADSTAYSYRAPIARHVVNERGERAVLFGERRYSVTTAKHQTYCRSSIPDGVPVFTVPDMGGVWGSEHPSHARNLRHYSERVAEYDGKAKRARVHRYRYAAVSLEYQQEANRYCQFFDLASAYDASVLAELERAQEAARVAQERIDRENRAVYDATMRHDYEPDVARWLDGANVTLPYDYPDVLLRIHVSHDPIVFNKDTSEVETSKGARVSLIEAERVYRLLQARTVAKGERVGAYTVARLDSDAIQVGCHYIKLVEIERFAATQGWNAAPASVEAR